MKIVKLNFTLKNFKLNLTKQNTNSVDVFLNTIVQNQQRSKFIFFNVNASRINKMKKRAKEIGHYF